MTNGLARRVRPRELVAPEFVRELAQSGFIDSLYARPEPGGRAR